MRERERDVTQLANQSHAAPDNQATTILCNHCNHLNFLPCLLSLFLLHLSSRLAPLSYLCISIYRSRLNLWFLSPFFLCTSSPQNQPQHRLSFLAYSFAFRFYICLSIFLVSSVRLSLSLFLSVSSASFHCRLARAFIEPAKHQPILHLNLVNLPELANELRAWCLILAHEHGRRYTASNASGESIRVYSPS